jgi:hypothetical protein
VSWADFACRLADAAELPVDLIEAVPGARLGQRAARPAFAALSSERGWVMPSLEVAIDQYLRVLAGGAADSTQDDVLTDHGLHPLTPQLEEAMR